MTPRRPTQADHRARQDRPAQSGRVSVVVKGLGALLLVLAFIAGVPYLLIRIGALPTTIPDPAALWQAAIGPDVSGRAVFVVLAAMVWIGWAWFTLSVLRETAAAIHSRGRRPARTLRLMSSRVSWSAQPATILVAAIVAIFVTTPLLAAGAPQALAATGHTGNDPVHRPGTVATATLENTAAYSVSAWAGSAGSAAAPIHHTSTAPKPGGIVTSASASTNPDAVTTTYTVRRYDTLWSIAKKQLGDPTRYHEIVTLNPHLQRDTTIHTGETLTLPHHHSGSTASAKPGHHTAPTNTATLDTGGQTVEHVTVQNGDTVSGISAEHGVHDWHTVWATNKGRIEPGGKRFTNPDHIEVGWTLDVSHSNQAASAAIPGEQASSDHANPPAATPPAPATAAQDTTRTHDETSAVGADHRHGLADDQAAPPQSSSQVPGPLLVQPAGPQAAPQPGRQQALEASPPSTQTQTERSLATVAEYVAEYVAGGTVLAAGMFAALVLVRRQQWRVRRPGRTIASTPPQLIPIERAIVAAASPSADETARVDQVLRRVAATDITPLHVAAVQLTAGDITLYLSEPVSLPAPWRAGPSGSVAAAGAMPEGAGDHLGATSAGGVVWMFPAGEDPEAAGVDPAIVDAIAPYPTLVHVGSDATSAWLLNLEQLGGLVLTGDRDRCLALARVMSAQMGVNAWAELVTVTMLGFGEELVETAPSRLRHAPVEQAGAVLASATAAATTTAEYSDKLGMPVVEARRIAANDEAWGVHVLVTAPPVTDDPTGGHPDERPGVAELLDVLHARAGATAAAVVVIDEHPRGPGFSGATVAQLDASGTLTLPDVGLTVQAVGWDEETSRGVGMLMAHLRNAPNEAVPDSRGSQPWQQLTDNAGALRADLVQPRSTPTVHDSSRPTGATTLPLADEAYLSIAATTAEDLQVLAPTVPADVLEKVMAADPTLDDDVAAWFDQDSTRAKLVVLGPLALTTTQPPPKRVAYYAELAAYLGFRKHGATADQIRTAFSLTTGTSRAYLSTLREFLGTDPLTGEHYLAAAKHSAAGKARGVGVYQVDGLLLDAHLFRRLRARGEARGPAGLEDYATALRLVTGPPFSQMRDEGGAWLLEGDRVDHHLTVAIVDVAHLLATSALAAGDSASARAAVDIARLAAPDEEAPRLDSAAVDRAEGRAAQARRTLVEQVCNRSDDGEPPMDLNPRTREILARHRDWLSRAS